MDLYLYLNLPESEWTGPNKKGPYAGGYMEEAAAKNISFSYISADFQERFELQLLREVEYSTGSASVSTYYWLVSVTPMDGGI